MYSLTKKYSNPAAHPFLFEKGSDTVLLAQQTHSIPGSVSYNIYRYEKLPIWEAQDQAFLQYGLIGGKLNSATIQLSFCIYGKMYCAHSSKKCGNCPKNFSDCDGELASVDVLMFKFSAGYFNQFLEEGAGHHDALLSVFTSLPEENSRQQLNVCGKTKKLIDNLLNHSYEGAMANIFVNAQLQLLLLQSLDNLLRKPEVPVFTCKFLANNADRDKIIHAKDVLLQHIGEPITIKALSRKVGINECYLKKGFKEVFGSTIFEFYQNQRMEHAKYLLYDKGLSVTEVSDLLGYSSISHFSTAFKKQTGIKPCELLNRG